MADKKTIKRYKLNVKYTSDEIWKLYNRYRDLSLIPNIVIIFVTFGDECYFNPMFTANWEELLYETPFEDLALYINNDTNEGSNEDIDIIRWRLEIGK